MYYIVDDCICKYRGEQVVLQRFILTLCVLVTLSACGQRTFVEAPEGRVQDSRSY